MSIINTFDNTTKAILSPEDFLGEHPKIADICIATFSNAVRDMVIEKYNCEIVAYSGTTNGKIPIYRLKNTNNILFYMSPIGSAISGTVMDEVRCLTGVTKFVVFGSCGIIDPQCKTQIIVPTAAYRDEGFSYHLAPADDYIDVNNHNKVKAIFDKFNIEYTMGKVWTTDALYRETIKNKDTRKAEGCICVDMECSGLQALCNFRGLEYYTFFFSGDSLANHEWEQRILGTEAEDDTQNACFKLALTIAENI